MYVSNQRSIGGLYFTVANRPRTITWKTKHKYLVSLLPHGLEPQHALVPILQDVKHQDITMEVEVTGIKQKYLVRFYGVIMKISFIIQFENKLF